MRLTKTSVANAIARLDRGETPPHANSRAQLQYALKLLEQAEQAYQESGMKALAPTVEWYTPGLYIDSARAAMGAIDLDPASCEFANRTVKADRFYTKEDDGLYQPWNGRIWCNPPYGKFTRLFMDKAVEEYDTGRLKEAIFLVNRTGAAWYKDRLPDFGRIEVRKRIAFIGPNGQPAKSPGYYNDLLYLGRRPHMFYKAFSWCR